MRIGFVGQCVAEVLLLESAGSFRRVFHYGCHDKLTLTSPIYYLLEGEKSPDSTDSGIICMILYPSTYMPLSQTREVLLQSLEDVIVWMETQTQSQQDEMALDEKVLQFQRYSILDSVQSDNSPYSNPVVCTLGVLPDSQSK